MLPVANFTLMKKTWIVPLTGLLVASLSLSGCGVRFDDGSGNAVRASVTQMARYRASTCQEAIGAGIEHIFAGDPKLAAFKNNFAARSKVLGPRWPTPQVKLSGKEETENLPEPGKYRIPGNGKALAQKLADCQADTLKDAGELVTLAREQLTASEGDEKATAQAQETMSLAKVLFAAGVAMQRENKQITAAASLTLPPANPTPLTAQRYQEGKWHPDKTKTDQNRQDNQASPLTKQQSSELREGIRQLDAVRFNMEKQVAQGQDVKLKTLVSEVITPLLLRQEQELIAQLGTDPRDAVYQPYAGLGGADKSAVVSGLGLAGQVQMDLLAVVPDVQKALVPETLASLVDLQAQLGKDAGVLPGLNAQDAKVKISTPSSVK